MASLVFLRGEGTRRAREPTLKLQQTTPSFDDFLCVAGIIVFRGKTSPQANIQFKESD